MSVRSLGAAAGVAYSTVARIESGRMDPTMGMLTRLLTAAGHDLHLTATSSHLPQLADLRDAWATDTRGQDRPDWTRLRNFLDHLYRHPNQRAMAIARQPARSGSAFLDCLLAGIAEKTADDAGLPRPPWTRRIPSLGDPWISPGTPRMIANYRAATPPQLASRGITLTADSLWRPAEAKGA